MLTLFTGDPKHVAVAASADKTLVEAVAGKRIAVLGFAASAGAAGCTFKFQSDITPVTTTTTTSSPTTTEEPTTTTTTPLPASDLTGARAVAANAEVNYNLQGIPHFVTQPGEGLNLIVSAGEINGSLVYQVIN